MGWDGMGWDIAQVSKISPLLPLLSLFQGGRDFRRGGRNRVNSLIKRNL